MVSIKNYATGCVSYSGETTLATRELFTCPRKFFPRGVSVRALFRVCFFETNALWTCPAFSISVFSPVVRRGKSCSGNRGLRIVIRAENSRFLLSPRFPAGTLAARDMVAKTPYFPKTISCLPVIMGETGDSGRNSGFRWTWKEADKPERISGESLDDSQNRD